MRTGRRAAATAVRRLLRRRGRELAELFLLDKHELWSRRRFRGWRPDCDAALLIGFPFSPLSEAARRLTAAEIPYVVDAGDPWVLTGPGPIASLADGARHGRSSGFGKGPRARS